MLEHEEPQYPEVKFCQGCGGRLVPREDHEGKARLVCEACGRVQYKNPIPAVAVLVLTAAGELLLVKRKLPPRAGMWALPSGYMEIYLTPEENAVAELKEETGLEGEVERFIAWYYGYSPIYERVLSLGFRMQVTGGKLQAGDDAEEAVFHPLKELPPIAFAAHRSFIRLETGLEI
jgi:ADP-ribose pyrophosphatase YjhB (NUDIX family)